MDTQNLLEKDSTSEETCQAQKCKPQINADKTCIIADEMRRLIQDIDEPIHPDLVCANYSCPHNVFYNKLFEIDGARNEWTPNYSSELSRRLRNCMCLLDEAVSDINYGNGVKPAFDSEGASYEKIADIYNTTKQSIQQFEARILQRARKILKKNGITKDEIV